MTTNPKPDHCRIIIVNDVLGTRTEIDSPQSVEEALQNHGDVITADLWLSHLEIVRPEDFLTQPIGVCIRHNDEEIHIRWHVVDGDEEAVCMAWKDVLDLRREWA
ncbi:MAG: hypothetical protein A2V70_06185 [Planctomycetes bacterium RBG_13_63_9]|nr:MAG: hypothetical protein A2V70_06185 [Planctomycetes bacterium RBG_13_63_9]